MAGSVATKFTRIFVSFTDGQKVRHPVDFCQCLLELCHNNSKTDDKRDHSLQSCAEERNTTYVKCFLEQDTLILSKAKQENGGVMLKHPPFCPMLRISKEGISELPADISSRGVDVGVVALLQSSDNRVLLTRRAAHMRTFPSTWVPPGGHIEQGESLFQALAREVCEETGLIIGGADEQLLCAWESVYPYVLTMGQPKRHHLVLYYLIKLQKSYTELASEMKLDKSEVDGACWCDEDLAKLIAGIQEIPIRHVDKNMEIRQFCKKTESWIDSVLPYSVFLTDAPTCGPDIERVSTGTRFALEEWIKL